MDGSGQNGRRPRRQDSAVSTTSSGDRTVRASSNRGRRRSSGSQPRTGPPTPRKGIFARLTGSSAKHSSSDSDVEDDDDDGAMDEQEGASSVHDNDRVSSPNGVEGRTWEMDDKEAGPSDYWRRSRSPSPVHVMSFPPSGWKMGSSGMWDGHAEDGPSDEWRPNTPPPGTDHFPFTPPYPSKTAGLEDTDSPGISTPNEIDDEAQFAKRLKDVFVQPSPTKARSTENGDGSPMSSRPRSLRNGYNSEFQDIVGSPAGRVGDEEFGTLEFPQKDDMSDRSPSISSSSYRNADQSGSNLSPMRLKRQSTTPYVHPSISRLRSHMRSSSSNSQASLSGRPAHLLHNRIPSHFSQISLARSDSTSNISSVLNPPPASVPAPKSEDPAFTFHPMRQLSAHLFSKRSGGRAAKQAEEGPQIALGKPTVMAVKGVIAVGTDNGYVAVYSFNQELRCILGTQATTAASGAVTCVTISPDETYVGVGHATGNIYLYDLASPNKPSRTSLALTLKQVMSGRKEGHLQGSKILHIGFVAARHTAIISGDEHGRAFWLSLGRVMGVDSNDVVRILGSYPERETPTARPASPSSTQSGSLRGSQRSKRATTLLASGPLPLGAEPHKSDQFQLSALLTPSKLVIVGMKPTAKTWYRKMRDSTGGASGGYTGCAAWLRSGELAPQSDPVLAYAWGQSVRFLRVKTSSTAGDDSPVAAKDDKPQFVDGNKFEAPNPVKALQWFDSDHVVLVTTAEIILLDVRNMRPVENTALATHMLTSNDSFADFATKSGLADIATTALYGSIQVHRNKLFILSRSNVQVGTLQHWNDRILACVHRGDFLEAIQVALSYYDNRANGNTIDLPSDETERKALIGARVRELLKASLDWAFSEDRMRDDTHYSSDGRGVDLTTLFEGLAKSCVEACLTMSDLDYLFDEAYENYSNVGIQNIFLQVLEPYIFDQRIRNVPPTIIQALIAMHEDKAELDLAEAVIWNVEPMWLDINQAVTLCEKHGLWDALIHVYTQAMKDYVAPLVKLLKLVREIQVHRKHRDYGVGASGEVDMEANAPNAYKIFAYIEHILSGISYPGGGSLPPTEAEDAKAAVYSFIFAGRPMIWPQGSDGRVIFPEDGERPYPYLDILLQFDTEAFLHSMDIAFEDSYLNDSRSVVNRQSIINIMLDIMDPEVYHSTEVTLLHIFVARNLPKYPQFLFIPPSTLHRILVSLAQDPDQSSREDRQLAAEYLLSAYKPHDMDVMLQLFETAGFYRILRSSFRQEQRWEPLISTLIKDPELDMEVFAEIEEIIKQTSKSAKSALPDEVKRGIVDALPHLFDLSVQQTAILIDRSASTLHKKAIDLLDGSDHKQMAYLRCLLDPSSDDSDERDGLASSAPPSKKLDNIARHKYVSMLHRHESASVIGFLDKQGPDAFDLPLLTQQMEDSRCFEGQLWCLDRQGLLKETFETTGDLLRSQGVDLAQTMVNKDEGTLHLVLENLQSISHMAMRLCREHSSEKREGLEDIWYGVLHEMLELSHSTNTLSSKDDTAGYSVRETLRAILQETLSALVASSSSSLSFPRLFKRLVDSSSTANKGGSKKGRAYSEFRSILTGMLDSYRSEGDMLAMTTKLVEADLFVSVEKMIRKRQQGWRPAEIACAQCGETLVGSEATGTILVMGSGRLVHQSCAEGSETAGETKGASV